MQFCSSPSAVWKPTFLHENHRCAPPIAIPVLFKQVTLLHFSRRNVYWLYKSVDFPLSWTSIMHWTFLGKTSIQSLDVYHIFTISYQGESFISLTITNQIGKPCVFFKLKNNTVLELPGEFTDWNLLTKHSSLYLNIWKGILKISNLTSHTLIKPHLRGCTGLWSRGHLNFSHMEEKLGSDCVLHK